MLINSMKPKKGKIKPTKAWAVIFPEWESYGWKNPYWEPPLCERDGNVFGISIFLIKKEAVKWNSKKGKIIPVLITPLNSEKEKK